MAPVNVQLEHAEESDTMSAGWKVHFTDAWLQEMSKLSMLKSLTLCELVGKCMLGMHGYPDQRQRRKRVGVHHNEVGIGGEECCEG